MDGHSGRVPHAERDRRAVRRVRRRHGEVAALGVRRREHVELAVAPAADARGRVVSEEAVLAEVLAESAEADEERTSERRLAEER